MWMENILKCFVEHMVKGPIVWNIYIYPWNWMELELQSMANNIGNYMDEFKSGMKQVKTNITQQLPIIMK